MNSHTGHAPRRGALLDELDSLRFSGIPERNEEEDGLDRETDERASGETRWQVRSLTEVPAQVDMDEMEDASDEPIAMPPQMRRRLEREAAAEEAPQAEPIQMEQAQKSKRRRASSS